jgi:hypothetical protein
MDLLIGFELGKKYIEAFEVFVRNGCICRRAVMRVDGVNVEYGWDGHAQQHVVGSSSP